MVTATLYHLEIPMNRSFIHSQSHRCTAESVILILRHAGAEGIGECVPRTYVTGESIDSVISTVSSINIDSLISSLNLSNLDNAIFSLYKLLFMDNLFSVDQNLNVVCLIEMAILDLIGNYFQLSIKDILRKYFITAPLKSFRTKKSISTSQVMDLSLTPEEFINYYGPFHMVKIKLTKNINENLSRVKYIRKKLSYNIPIIADVNMGWQLDDALENISLLKPYHISYFEEPLKKHSWHEYKTLREEMDIKILLDESVCSINDANAAIRNKSCDAFNIRLSKCGGFIRATQLLKIANKNNIAYQIGAQVAETGPLLAASRQLATATNHFFSYEAGQADRQFSNYIISPFPSIDRSTNTANLIGGYGLGVSINSNLQNYIKNGIKWKNKWCDLG